MSQEPARAALSPVSAEAGEGVSLRPQSLAEYVGQAALKRKLEVFVRAARGRDEPLDHTLLHGPPGLGKTTMAHILAHELGVRLHLTSGPAIEHKGVLAGHLTALGPRDVLFIDEIHRLAPTVEESLYSAMEDGRIDLPVGEGNRARTIGFELAPFTLIGATTRTALLSGPLRDRFQIIEAIEFYGDDELAAIVCRTASILGILVSGAAALEIGRRSRGTPRIANRLIRRVRDFAQVRGARSIELADATASLLELGIDSEGLDMLDRRLMTMIVENFRGGPVGVDAVAASLGEPRDTLESVVEPFLLQRGFLLRTSRGRVATLKAARHLGLELPPGWQGALDL
ncbi:Holliday junction branch migration DNA helicase RuvB [Nannocystis bainbridge]|uniref:Holliday junction branch migration complex subunit RuvB n=1 Tax=Nannocystis bainbridge TaxID=2995303 RepID=A0ABT5E190_9BACT|nr:Holliday junction branch migration DNA helicase RuvB [Nannocystis bainbridge]MDC0719571.1 Holliday junction branch migration DNA helicase RuvB [Nannocystis bainbridge]